jgi:hypothetical protein
MEPTKIDANLDEADIDEIEEHFNIADSVKVDEYILALKAKISRKMYPYLPAMFSQTYRKRAFTSSEAVRTA